VKVEVVPIGSVHADPANVRKHDDRNTSAIAASLARFGQQRPLVIDARGVVRAGNGTLEAARSLGWTEIAVVRTGLGGSEATAYAIADNRTSDLSSFDDTGLAEILRSLQSEEDPAVFEATGFTAEELDGLLGRLGEDAIGADRADDGIDPSAYGGATAMHRGNAAVRFWREAGFLGGDVLDFGCGHEDHGFPRYDAFHCPDPAPLLATYDVVMCNYVLNVQPSDHLITLIACLISRLLRDSGKALFAVRNDMDEGLHESPRGIQNVKPPAEWEALLGDFFWVEPQEGARGFYAYVCTPMRGSDRSGSTG